MNTRDARAAGYDVIRGDYTGTVDDNADRWYVEPILGPCDRAYPGFGTQAEALDALDRMLQGRQI